MPPKGTRQANLRACLVCSLLQTPKDFVEMGCPNCEDVCEMRGSMERVAECTSTIYDGMIAMMEPEESWVARWQRISCCVPSTNLDTVLPHKKRRGLYAVRVTGRPPQDVIEAIESRGGMYRPRDAVEEL